MHELGVVFHCIKEVKEIAAENKVSRVTGVTVRIGEVSAVLPDLFEDCWDWAVKKEDILKDAKVKIEPIKAVTHCDTCGLDYETVKYAKICPQCGGNQTWLLTGNEIIIQELEVPEEELPPESE